MSHKRYRNLDRQITNVCHHCYAFIPVAAQSPRADAKYCSPKCRQAAYRQRKREADGLTGIERRNQATAKRLETKRAKTYIIICDYCSEVFDRDGTQTAARYCSNACRQKAYRERKARKALEKQKPEMPSWECPKCGEITEHKPRYYTDGSMMFIHEQRMVKGPIPHMLIGKTCSMPDVHNKMGLGLSKAGVRRLLSP